MENNKTKTRQELESYLKSLLQFMLKSGQAYDMGFEGEAQRLAVAMKAILYDQDGGGSLLDRLGLDLYFYDNCPDYDEKLALPMSGLALYAPSNKDRNKYAPRLGRNPGVTMKKAKFGDWWSKPVIVDDGKGIRLTRKDVINAVSNTDAQGARPVLNEDFNKLIKENPIGWVNEKAGLKKEPLLGMEFASARHIAFEVLVSFEEQLPHYFEGLYPN